MANDGGFFVHVGVIVSEGHSDFVVFSVSCDEIFESLLVFEVVVSGWVNEKMDDLNSMMKRKRNTREMMTSLRLDESCVLDLMVSIWLFW